MDCTWIRSSVFYPVLQEFSEVQDVTVYNKSMSVLYNVKTWEEQTVQIQTVAPQSLLEACARFIGQNLPFELVQLHPQRVPEEVQKRIVYWSFPLKEKRLLEFEYAKISMMGDTEPEKIPIENMTQIGEFVMCVDS